MKGILPLPRLSLRHIDSVVLCTGASPISNVTGVAFGEKLGFVSKAEIRKINKKSCVHLLPQEDASRVQTVVLSGLTEQVVEESKGTAEACIKVLWRALKVGCV